MLSRFFVSTLPILAFVAIAFLRPSFGAAESEAARKRAFLESKKTPASTAGNPSTSKKTTPPTAKKTPLPPKRPTSPPPKKAPSKTAPKPIPKPTPKPTPKSSPVTKPSQTPPIKPPASENPPVAGITPAPVIIEKSSELTQPLEAEKKGFFSIFGPKQKGKFITPPLRDQINRPSIIKGRWKYIVVHNSGTRQGNAKAFDDYHSRVRKMQNGLAYHFVIGNGTSTGDGQIEIGNRWKNQLAGGHVHSDYLNNVGIGICLVGDYNHHKPTPKQLESLEELIRFLRNRVGKSEGKEVVVKPHRDINPPRWPTDCPGDQFPYSWLKSRF